MSIRIKLHGVRISFANGLNNKSSIRGGTPKYGVDFILQPDTRILEKTAAGWMPVASIDEIMQRVATDTWKTEAMGKKMLASLEASKLCLRDGDLRTSASGEVYDGYAGRRYITAKNTTRPQCWAKDGSVLPEDRRTEIYSGCYVVGLVDIYGNFKPDTKGVFSALLGAQFLADGDAFAGGAPVDASDMDDLSDVGETVDDMIG